MIKKNFTPTPNILFDQFLKELSNSEIKILLVIIRQTNGWIDKKTGKRKGRDRITYSQFIKKTGLSRRIISEAISSLCKKELIRITDNSGKNLNTPNERKGQLSIYYSSLLEHMQLLHRLTSAKHNTNICKNRHEHVQNMVYNKRNYKERNISKENETDFKHIKEIIDEKRLNWNL
jgi:phage replication O-like protein O